MSESHKKFETHDLQSLTTRDVYRKLIEACVAHAQVTAQLKEEAILPEERQQLTALGEQFHSQIVQYAREYEERPLEEGV